MSRPDEDKIRDFFCEAMMYGWVSGAEPLELPNFPGFKCYEHREGPFRLIDAFCSGEDMLAALEVADELRASSGQTTIWYIDKPVWVMSYSGEYPKHVLPFLKNVLWHAYSHHAPIGGRGGYFESNGAFTYINRNYQRETNFANSSGTEYIYETSSEGVIILGGASEIGHHHYRCLLL